MTVNTNISIYSNVRENRGKRTKTTRLIVHLTHEFPLSVFTCISFTSHPFFFLSFFHTLVFSWFTFSVRAMTLIITIRTKMIYWWETKYHIQCGIVAFSKYNNIPRTTHTHKEAHEDTNHARRNAMQCVCKNWRKRNYNNNDIRNFDARKCATTRKNKSMWRIKIKMEEEKGREAKWRQWVMTLLSHHDQFQWCIHFGRTLTKVIFEMLFFENNWMLNHHFFSLNKCSAALIFMSKNFNQPIWRYQMYPSSNIIK